MKRIWVLEKSYSQGSALSCTDEATAKAIANATDLKAVEVPLIVTNDVNLTEYDFAEEADDEPRF